MSVLRIGSLFSGYAGLDLAVEQFFDADTAWFCEYDAAPSAILAHHFPGIPNLGDITKVDWSQVEPVDIICGGSPCQDVSGAGKRKGMTEGTRSNLWVQMREAIAIIKPSIVIWENVQGAYSARADSDVESEPRLLGNSGNGEPFLRALGRVLGDLSELGFDAEVVPVRASDVGAPHARFRVFVVAHARRLLGGNGWDTAPGQTAGGRAPADVSGSGGAHAAPTLRLMPTPTTQDGSNTGGPSQYERNTLPLNTEVTLLPTPTATYGGGTAEAHLARKNKNGGNRTSVTGLNFIAEEDLPKLDAVAEYVTLLPTPRASRGASNTETLYALGALRDNDGDEQGNVLLEPAFETHSAGEYRELWDSLEDQSPYWLTVKGDDYWPAISRWAAVLGRPAPSPTVPDGKNGRHRLNARFTEWLMGCADGWITDPAIYADLGWSESKVRNAGLKAGGNGVVTLQAFAALTIAWERIRKELVA
ncbi:DNA cytosine methyltransferase [Glaciihabitans sp. UYNi722]|uniref:DNA cytosine methyltransferase n=1 Tax=Glaciihabitans sp. UYNi722 TaxID=3156344 RepID=UPI00339B3AAF